MDEYWALAPKDQIANEVIAKWAAYHGWLQTSGLRDVIQACYDAFYSFQDGGFGITKSKDGSSAKMKVPHFKSLVIRSKSLVTQSKLNYQPKAINSESSSQIQSDFAKGLLDYYGDDKGMTAVVSDMVEKGLICLDSYVYGPWDTHKGEQIREGHYTGDQNFHVLTRFDVASHTSVKESPYYIVRLLMNKYDLIAEYPQFADAIMKTGGRNQNEYILTPTNNGKYSMDDDMVEVYTLLHDRTLAVPQGRLTVVVGTEAIEDIALPYREMPIVHFQPAKLQETVVGDSPVTSLLSLQQAIDALYSALISNNLSYAKQNIWSPSPIQVEALGEGFNNIVSAQKPEPLQLVASAQETYKFLELMQGQQQILSGVNSTARGNPEASLKTNGSLALMLAVAIQFADDTQKAYAICGGKLATIVICNLQEFASEPRLAYIGGSSRKSTIKEFTAKDLLSIKRISCEISNPLTQNIAGRYELVQQWQQFGIVKDPKKLVEFLRTGQLDSLTEDDFKDSILVREENEMLRRGELPIVMITDLHPGHILEHKSIANDQEARKDPNIMANLTTHIQDHMDTMANMTPDLAAILGLQPLPSQQMPPPGPPPPEGPPQLDMPPDQVGIADEEAKLPQLPENTPEQFQGMVANG